MKIWKAKLILIYDENNNWNSIFHFDSDDKDYIADENAKEWTYWQNWTARVIPMNMTVNRTFSDSLTIVQGFDRELQANELCILEQEMRQLMIKTLKQEREYFLDEYNNKINALETTSIQ